MKQELTAEAIWAQYEKGVSFNEQIQLYETVEANENFYIGKQWEGVNANGLPTPVFNFIKRIVLYLVASTATDNIAMAVHPLSSTCAGTAAEVERICNVMNAQFRALYEQNKCGKQVREFMRDAAVRCDGCIYSWFDPEADTGQSAKGTIRTEVLENTRVIFGNPNVREVQSQPYLIISRRERVEDVRREAERNGLNPDEIRGDSDEVNDRFYQMTSDKVTTLTRFERRDGVIWCVRSVKDSILRPEWDTGQRLYPIAWMPWDYVQNCYHGQAAVTGLIPNQIFVNKAFAMTMISLMTTAFPKVVYDKNRIAKWNSGVGQAIAVNGGDINGVAKTIDPATISPQVSQFISMAINLTKEFMGATDAALGDTRPDNTSAIIALQKASSVPLELTKQNLFQAIEDLGRIWLDQMRAYYGLRYVELPLTEAEKQQAQAMGAPVPNGPVPTLFDFSILDTVPLSLRLDVGGSAYWSEIAQMNTLDNLLMQGKISVIDYLERVPNGYISNQQELIQTLRAREQAASAAMGLAQGTEGAGAGAPLTGDTPQLQGGPGYGALQRKINEVGMEGLDISALQGGPN